MITSLYSLTAVAIEAESLICYAFLSPYFSYSSTNKHFVWNISCWPFDITIVLFSSCQLDISSDIASTVLTFKSRGVEQEELAFLRGELQDARFIIEAKDGQNETLLFDDSEK